MLWIVSNLNPCSAAPTKPPIKVWDEEDGIPFHQVIKFKLLQLTSDKITINLYFSMGSFLHNYLQLQSQTQ
jgi:hypothetical protein